jgi:ABC-type bacteriocin/lantibiotic exporter with double-glycine peptidase domain
MKNILKEFNLHEGSKNKNNKKIEINKNFKIQSISSKDLEFQYPNSQLSVLKNISLRIKRGEFVGIIGNSGSGKSTLIDIILGLFSPTSGEMKINDSSEFSLVDDFEKKIGYVPQDIYLMDDTIEKNIALGVKEKNIDKNKIIKLINDLKLESIISQSKDGIKTHIGNRGIKLSGGQRQRIGIARALYKDPEILILDEATNALDIDTEKNIFETLYNLKNDRITILINHRVDMLSNCDNIYVLDKGEIVKQGKLNNLSGIRIDN